MELSFKKLQTRFRQAATNWSVAVVVSVMILVLIMVAVLQYRWTTLVTRATKLQMGQELAGLMTDWHFDLYREFSSICITLQVGPDFGAQDGWEDYRLRLARWKAEAEFPDLAAGVYVWETNRVPEPRLIDLESGADVAGGYLSEDHLSNLLLRLQKSSSNLATAARAWEYHPDTASRHTSAVAEGGGLGRNSLTGWQFDQAVPALVHPIVHHRLPGDTDSSQSKNIDWMIVVLNRDTLQKKVLPALTHRYFDGIDGRPEYSVVITEGAQEANVLYTSNQAATDDLKKDPDANMVVFGPAIDASVPHLRATLKNGDSFNLQNLSSPVWFPVIQYSAEQEPWKLLLDRHRGSPDDVVRQVRSRNLAISGIVLVLLAMSMGLLVLNSARRQSLAKAQLDFVASVSHELRTPLAIMASASDNIADGLVEGKQQIGRYGAMLREQTRQLTDLVEQVLLFVAVKDDRDHYDIQTLEVADFVNLAISNTSYLVQRAGFALVCQIQPDLPPVNGDLRALTRCLQNLITNAVKYSGESRRIEIEARIMDTLRPGQITIAVRDFGIGISDADRLHILEPFFRSAAVSQAQIAGTGLGLALANRIALMMGGKLEVESALGKGSTFILSLPPAERLKDPVQLNADQGTTLQ